MAHFQLFEVAGVELEYMVVDAVSLETRPVVDELFERMTGQVTSDVEIGGVSWSNELAAHVLELKTTRPEPAMEKLPGSFLQAVQSLQATLKPMGLRLLPTAMHPWMDPRRETQLWEHENHEIYQAFHRIFDCHTHGWANVQSVHLNLPFAGEHQFRQLHAAVRLILPLLPALAASSPVFDGRVAEDLDSRLVHYRQHCERVPSLIGRVIPEPVYDRDQYHRLIFDPIGSDITPLDVDQVMEVEFLNARGAIARFDRGSIEIRLMDVQESPRVDVAICALVTGVLKLLVQETWSSVDDQCDVSVDVLRSNLDEATRHAEQAEFNGSSYLRHLGIQTSQVQARECWGHLFAQVQAAGFLHPDFEETIRFLLDHGTLAHRIRQALGDPGVGQVLAREKLHRVYGRLADCLVDGVHFQP